VAFRLVAPVKPVTVTRDQILGRRLRTSHLDRRLAREDIDKAAYVGLQDSVPRSALLSLHARVEDVDFDAWDDPRLVQVWGPRGSVYVIPKDDFAVFTLGRLPRDADQRRVVEEDGQRVRELLEVSDRTGLKTATEGSVRRVREAGATGTIRIRWDGSSIEAWAVEPPDADLETCRLELARRYLHVFAPSTPSHFATWAGIDRQDAADTWVALRDELVDVLVSNSVRQVSAETHLAAAAEEDEIPKTTRLLPPGDTYLLARDREIVVPDKRNRSQLWPQGNVPPGGLLVDGELAGTWRRQLHAFTISMWKSVASGVKDLIQTEIHEMPPLGTGEPTMRWTSP
jgi:hypothetical protein